jgi:hypothetical protein
MFNVKKAFLLIFLHYIGWCMESNIQSGIICKELNK